MGFNQKRPTDQAGGQRSGRHYARPDRRVEVARIRQRKTRRSASRGGDANQGLGQGREGTLTKSFGPDRKSLGGEQTHQGGFA